MRHNIGNIISNHVRKMFCHSRSDDFPLKSRHSFSESPALCRGERVNGVDDTISNLREVTALVGPGLLYAMFLFVDC